MCAKDIILLACILVGVQAQYTVVWKEFTINSWDGTVLQANVGIPNPINQGERFPAVVLANSWGVPTFEYLYKTLQWAEAGYVVLEYQTRGFYESGGEIDTAGPNDQKDFSSVVDYLVASNWSVDVNNIATCGISYGAGLALLGAGRDPRIKTAIAMSGWANLTTALFGGEAPSLIWGDLLIEVGKITGRIPPEVGNLFNQLLHHENITGLKRWSDLRSAESFVQSIISRKVPLFISNNFEDRLFKPDAALKFFQELEGIPKYILLNQGIHASAEIAGLFGLSNYVWTKARSWLDYWLKGIKNGITDEPPLHFQSRTDPSKYISFQSWPSPTVVSTDYSLVPRGSNFFGQLEIPGSSSGGKDTISFGQNSGLFAGVPILGELLQAWFDIPILSDFYLVNRSSAVVYVSKPLTNTVRLCGIPNVTLSITPNANSFQVVTYLYSVDFLGVGTLLSHGPRNDYYANPGIPNILVVSMRTLCYDIKAGNSIGVGINMFSEMYQTANSNSTLSVAINSDGGVNSQLSSFISLPINSL